MRNDHDSWFRCTICGKEGTVGRCCGDDTRIPLNQKAVEELGLIRDAAKKNAVLISAAPEMLEALRWACEVLHCMHDCSNCPIGKAKFKAEGRE